MGNQTSSAASSGPDTRTAVQRPPPVRRGVPTHTRHSAPAHRVSETGSNNVYASLRQQGLTHDQISNILRRCAADQRASAVRASLQVRSAVRANTSRHRRDVSPVAQQFHDEQMQRTCIAPSATSSSYQPRVKPTLQMRPQRNTMEDRMQAHYHQRETERTAWDPPRAVDQPPPQSRLQNLSQHAQQEARRPPPQQQQGQRPPPPQQPLPPRTAPQAVEARRSAQSRAASEQRHRVFQEEMRRLKSNAHAAYRLLGMREEEPYTLRDLSKRYRALALHVHPDRSGGDARKFDDLTKAYLLLVERYKNEKTDRSFNELREDSRNALKQQASTSAAASEPTPAPPSGLRSRVGEGDQFDNKLFNRIYTENRLANPEDEGYGSWIQEAAAQEERAPVFSKQFNLDVFNTAFEQLKDEDDTCNSQIVKRDAPEAMVQYAGENTAFSDLGVEAMEDFSGSTTGGLRFTDLKKAHTSSKLINAKRVGYEQHATVKDLEVHREGMSFEMTPEETERQARRERATQDAEDQRRQNVHARDQMIADHHRRVEQLFLQ